MANAKNLIGKKFGKLTVIKRGGSYADGHAMWECLCECGKTAFVQSNNLQKKKSTKSCGCLVGVAARKRNKEKGVWNAGTSYSTSKKEYKNRKWWAKKSIEAYGKSCQVCGWEEGSCDVHHKTPRQFGGKNTVENAIILCPNCHRLSHEGKIDVCKKNRNIS